MMIQSQNIRKYYGANLVLSDVSFEIKKGDKVGLIGRNGTGKSTLLSLLNGSDTPDGGTLSIARGSTIASLAQIPRFAEEQSVHEVLHTAFDDLLHIQREMAVLEQQMAMADPAASMEQMLARYGKLQEQFQLQGGYEMEASISKIANGLGITESQLAQPVHSLSGGEKTKVGLAIILLRQPDLLLLDEPTNHLDMPSILWLEQFLKEFTGTVVVISHDRYFLDMVVDKIIEIEDGEAFTYHSNYSDYKVEKERQLLLQFAQYQEQQKKIKKMKEAIKQLIEWGNQSNPPNAGFHRRAASMQKALDRMTKLKRPILERKSIGLQLDLDDRTGKDVLVLKEISKSYDSKLLFHKVTHTLQYREKAVVIGANGSGKTTLFKSILGEVPLTEGEIKVGSRVQLGYLAQEEAPPAQSITVLRAYCDEVAMEQGEARAELAKFLFYGADVFKTVSNLSGGEWTRLRLAMLMQKKPNLLLLDEPTNHLDIDSREALEEALLNYAGSLLAISHDRYFINKIATQIWSIEQYKLIVTQGNYEDYEHERAKMSNLEKDAVSTTSHASQLIQPTRTKPADHNMKSTQNTQAAQTKNLIKQGEKLEQQIKEVEAQLEHIHTTMNDIQIASDVDKLIELQAQKDQLEIQLDTLLAQYLEL
ncbi:ATPase subunit of ABC transporter with duplicated ATPase domains [Paenibacillus turicensis]|uniref:ATPase subunit of ABC transporter with duplicated ATPase domains n=1 Tax=Paenibacillus turicensis TaxID=160487 RepID=A0ABS4FYW9_9BACL|nr:ABC-F family ATP-binding cassette domain-containing protein [Paenibacillus turicensis]MBP1907778.1 ATPase subunit of ABC transporter with duplicated ATPase domains [Paenibacillus turicensis]